MTIIYLHFAHTNCNGSSRTSDCVTFTGVLDVEDLVPRPFYSKKKINKHNLTLNMWKDNCLI